MSTDLRHLISRPSVRAAMLASALGAAVFAMSASSADAMGFRGSGSGGMHPNMANRAATYQRLSAVTLTRGTLA